MPVKIDIPFSASLVTAKDLTSTFNYFAALEHSIVTHFPALESFTQVEPSVYRWTFEKFSYGGNDIQVVLVTRFQPNAPNEIEMLPVAQAGMSQLRGRWKFSESGGGTKVEFSAELAAEIPIPSLLKAIAAPVTTREITKIFQRYMGNIGKALA